MKKIEKSKIFLTSSLECMKREITIHRELNHPNIIKLYHYFEDEEYVYLILEKAGLI